MKTAEYGMLSYPLHCLARELWRLGHKFDAALVEFQAVLFVLVAIIGFIKGRP